MTDRSGTDEAPEPQTWERLEAAIDYDHPRFTHEGNACTVGCGNFNELTFLRIQRERLLARIVRDSPLIQWAARDAATPLDITGIDLERDTIRAAFYDSSGAGGATE